VAFLALEGGGEMAARLADPLPPGAPCVLMVRPERVRLDATEGEGLPAQLTEALFQGDHVRLRLALPGGAEVIAKRPVGEAAMPAPGEAVRLGWAAAEARAFRDEGSAR
jgi:ABC-type Fe3+/spermidine/putrescine transport system ATPase subunit